MLLQEPGNYPGSRRRGIAGREALDGFYPRVSLFSIIVLKFPNEERLPEQPSLGLEIGEHEVIRPRVQDGISKGPSEALGRPLAFLLRAIRDPLASFEIRGQLVIVRLDA